MKCYQCDLFIVSYLDIGINDVSSTQEGETHDKSMSRADWPSHARHPKDNGNGMYLLHYA
jgi:hypothetical protein